MTLWASQRSSRLRFTLLLYTSVQGSVRIYPTPSPADNPSVVWIFGYFSHFAHSRMVFLSRLRRTRLLALLASARVVQRPPPVPFISVLMRPSAMSSFQGKGS